MSDLKIEFASETEACAVFVGGRDRGESFRGPRFPHVQTSSLGAFHTTFSGTMPLTSKDCDKGDVCGVL